jgi:hypothetical protein
VDETDCPAQKLIVGEDRAMLEATDPDAPLGRC